MSRFENLEFDGQSEERSLQSGVVTKDEAYYIAQANSALENAQWEQALRFFG